MTHQNVRLPGFQYDNLPENVYRIMGDYVCVGNEVQIKSLNLRDCQSLGSFDSFRLEAIRKISDCISNHKEIGWFSDEEIVDNFQNLKGNRVTVFITVLNPDKLIEYYSQWGVISCVGLLDELHQRYKIGYNYLNPGVKLEDIPIDYSACEMQISEIGEIQALNS